MTFRDPRLAGAGGARLIGILVEAFPDSRDAINKGSFAGLPQGAVGSSTPWNEWYAVIRWVDSEGRLQVLIDVLLEELHVQGRKIHRELSEWNKSRNVSNIAEATPQILRSLEMITSAPDPTTVEDQLLLLSTTLAELARRLADPRAPEVGFGGMADSARVARRAKDAARHASAAVDAYLFEVQAASTFLGESFTTHDRDRAEGLLAHGLVMRHLLDQRVLVDAVVSALLDALLAAFPTALDVTVEQRGS